jgi:hypothetical protein
MGVAGAISWPTRLFGASGDKLSQQQAEYQDSPKGIQMCATCTLFVAPRSCQVVEGDISPDGHRWASRNRPAHPDAPLF